ncbi:MAG: hypothetical protein WD845_16900 [Pirellulales bacterium]
MSEAPTNPGDAGTPRRRQFALKDLFITTAMVAIGVLGMGSVVDAQWTIERSTSWTIGIWYGSAALIVFGLTVPFGLSSRRSVFLVSIVGSLLGALLLWLVDFLMH